MKQFVICLCLLVMPLIQAQEKGHYMYFSTGGGFHDLSCKIQNGTEKGGTGFLFNAGYGYNFTQHWGLQTGVGLKSFQSSCTLDGLIVENSTDIDGDVYEFRADYNNWKENQNALYINIPLGIQNRLTLGEKTNLLTTVGCEIAFPMNSKYKVTSGEIVTTGYYSKWNVEIGDAPRHGLTTFTDRYTGAMPINTSYSVFADVGFLRKISYNTDLYIGAYFNYGLNNITDSNNLAVYQPDGVYNGIIGSNQIDKVIPVSIGLKFGLYLKLAR
jgi:OmpA-OmpF porin, OOP family